MSSMEMRSLEVPGSMSESWYFVICSHAQFASAVISCMTSEMSSSLRGGV